jgi:FR47-like protein
VDGGRHTAGLGGWVVIFGGGPACYDGAVERLRTLDQLRELCADPLVPRAAQDMSSNVQVWVHGTAIAAAMAGLARRHRVAVSGTVADIAVVVQALLDGPAPRYRLLGDHDTICQLCGVMPGLAPTPPFGWMTTTQPPGQVSANARLSRDGEQAAITQILDEVFPGSLARPGLPGITRWWVEIDATGVAACAADAWSAPGVGLLAGVAIANRARGRGLGRSVTVTALTALIHDYGTAALMVEADNAVARSLHRSLGMTYRAVRAAAPPPAKTADSAAEPHILT